MEKEEEEEEIFTAWPADDEEQDSAEEQEEEEEETERKRSLDIPRPSHSLTKRMLYRTLSKRFYLAQSSAHSPSI